MSGIRGGGETHAAVVHTKSQKVGIVYLRPCIGGVLPALT